ncbi:MAG: DUF2505 domain-containing protein [bacterium]|nr:DUF2505 domain-containing protein [bacterium]
MKKFTAEATYSIPATQVRSIQTDEAFADFLVERFAGEVGAEVRSRSVTQQGDREVLTAVVYAGPEKLPNMARRFLSKGVEVTIEQLWDAPAADGSHTGEFRLTTVPDRGSMRAGFVLRDDANGGSRRSYDGELSVNVPLVGGAIENQALKYTDRVMGIEARVLEMYLEQQEG